MKALATQARAERDDAIRAFKVPALPNETLVSRILDASVADLKAMLERGEITSVQLTSVFIARAHATGFALGALAEQQFAESLLAAAASDARRAAGDQPLGILEGIPISIKDMFHQRGTRSTCGLAAKCGTKSESDGLYLQLLRQAGAIPFVRSNVPQCLMVPETDCAPWGRAINPFDAKRTPGGSSGGEGALVSARCSPLGVGTDIGGSIRIPAAFCGVCGFKPTPERLTQLGLEAPRPGGIDGQNCVLPTAGPLAKTADDCALLMQALLHSGSKLWEGDAVVPRLPFDMDRYTNGPGRKLRVGYFVSDGFWEPAAACKRAVQEAAAALTAAGHEVVAFDPREHGVDTYAAALTYYGILGADGKLREFKRGLEGEALNPLYATLNVLASLPDAIVRPTLAWILRAVGYTRMGDLLAMARARRADELWALTAQREAWKRALLAAMRTQHIDLILCPALGLPAFTHGGSKDLTVICSYTFLWNLLHMPAGVVPVTTVRSDECSYDCPREQRDAFAAVARASMTGAAGLPVSVQLVGLPLQEEAVLHGMRELQTALGSGAPRGCPPERLAATLAELQQQKK